MGRLSWEGWQRHGQMEEIGVKASALRECLFPNLTDHEIAQVLSRGCDRQASLDEVAGSSVAWRDAPATLPHHPARVDPKALFLGPRAENADFMEQLLLEVFRDYVHWRRSFHPEDRAAIREEDGNSPAFKRFMAGFQVELRLLLDALQADVPFHSPRYMGHMLSDVSLPAFIGYFAALLHNPNNVSWEVSPVTTLMEIEASRHLAKMIGFGRTPQELSLTWGHITSGGTVANVESLWVAKALKFLPICVRGAARELGLEGLTAGVQGKNIEDLTPWDLVNLAPVEALDLRERLIKLHVERHCEAPVEETLNRVKESLKRHDILSLGDHAFFERWKGRDALRPATLCVPQSLHYSWVKGPALVGIGARQTTLIPVDSSYRMDTKALRKALESALRERRPVIAVVGVLGSTEEGAVDPMDEIAAIRDEFARRGLSFFLHCDAAYGGYMAACFRTPAGALRERADMAAEYGGWPSNGTYRSFAALSQVDSLTVDPHKLGFVPYPAGVVLFRDTRMKDLISQEAAYALGGSMERRPGEVYIGKYILEGSKPGAAASAVYLAHRVVSTDCQGYGVLLGQTIRIARTLHGRLLDLSKAIQDEFTVMPLYRPDLNVVSYLFNPVGNRRLDVLNRFNMALFRALTIDPARPATSRPFIVSHAELTHSIYGSEGLGRFLENMGIPGHLFVSSSRLPGSEGGGNEGRDDKVVVLRTACMNLFSLEEITEGKDYIGFFMESLPAVLRRVAEEMKSRADTMQ